MSEISLGTIINDRYKLDAEVGKGGMGTVYRAHDETLNREVAIKILIKDAFGTEGQARLLHEAQVIAKLDHPNIVTVFDVGEWEEAPYIIMQLIKGKTLNEHKPVDLDEIIAIAKQICAALQHAHEHGIIHRDLKPENVIIDESGTVKIMDFGLARSVTSRVSTEGHILGTVFYMSPDQIMGEDLDGRSDLYSFGVLLYELTTGEFPFEDNTPVAIISQHLHAPVIPPRAKNEELPPGLNDLILQLLEKNRDDRPANAKLVLEALEDPCLLDTDSLPKTISTRAASRKHNLPGQLTPFVGREITLAEIAERLQDPACRLLTLIGSGGSGKTRLAIETAFSQLDNYLNGVYFVSLAPLDSPETIIPTIAKAVGFTFYTTAGVGSHEQPQQSILAKQQLLNYLEHKSMLIIMDNFEHLLDGVELVGDILRTAPEVDILATSRVRLNVQGEHLYPVTGMNFPEWELADEAKMLPKDLEEYSAVKLFLQQALQAKPDFELTTENIPHILQTCRLVEGMPLGILLATGWLKVLSPEEIATEIGQSLDFLETDLSDTPERQRSMRFVFDHSWKLLTEREQEVFRKLSVFRGGFTRQAAKQVTSTSLRKLKALVDKSLLQRQPGGRYKLHELLRQYALEKLGSASDEERNVKDLHSSYYATYLQQRYERLIGEGWKESLSEIESEIENVRAGWQWATNQGRIDDINISLETLAEFYRMRSWYQEGEEAFAKVAERLEEEDALTSPKSRLALGRALSMQGWMCSYLSLIAKADDLLHKSLLILRDLDARREMAYALYFLGHNRFTWMGMIQYVEEAMSLFKDIGDQRGVTYSMELLGWAAIQQGDFSKAKHLFEESLSISREIGDQEGTPTYLNALGYLAWLLGNYEEAKNLHQECLAIYRDISSPHGIANAIANLARDAAGLKDYEEAKRLFHECLAIFKEIGAKFYIVVILTDLGELAIVMGEYDEAINLCQESFQVYREVTEREQSSKLSWYFRVLGEASLGLKDYQRAKEYLHKALDSAIINLRNPYILLSFIGIAQLLAIEGEKERSIELLTMVLHHPASWQWAKDKALPILTELETELPPALTKRAKKRGLARDLESTAEELLVELGK